MPDPQRHQLDDRIAKIIADANHVLCFLTQHGQTVAYLQLAAAFHERAAALLIDAASTHMEALT